MSKLQDREHDDLSFGFKDNRVYNKKDFNIAGLRKRPSKKKGYKRCPTCGGLVKMPCLLCSISFDERF
jgi:hypothetical protein